MDATGVLKPAAMQRVADAVARFLDVLRGFATPEHPAITTRAMATFMSMRTVRKMVIWRRMRVSMRSSTTSISGPPRSMP